MKLFLRAGHSLGRGVGYYADFLRQSLQTFPDIDLVDNLAEAELVHYTYFDLFYPTLPIHKTKPTILTIHDLTPLNLPNLYPLGIKSRLALLHQRLSLLNIRTFITDSEHSRSDLVRHFHLAPNKIHVVPLAADPIFLETPSPAQISQVAKKHNLPDRFVLTVAGGPNPNKNLVRLAQATADLHLPLVIVGGGMLQSLATPIHSELRDLATLRQFSHIITPGFIATPDLACFYRLASCYCQASLLEGFGLPVLEAMTAGCPVVCSHTGSLPEVIAPGTVTFDPYDSAAINSSVQQILDMTLIERKKYTDQAKIHSLQFTWQKTAAETIEAYTLSL